MKTTIFGAALSMILLLPAVPTLAEDNHDCSFAAPSALLRSQAYSAYAFRRAAHNEAFESGNIAKDIHFEIRQSQCEDFVTRKITFTLKANRGATPLDFAIKEISNLKFADASGRSNELLAFLKAGHKNREGSSFTACKDGSSAPPGVCSWESHGGYSFEVSRKREKVTISVTEYTSG